VSAGGGGRCGPHSLETAKSPALIGKSLWFRDIPYPGKAPREIASYRAAYVSSAAGATSVRRSNPLELAAFG
jgi:hypothetical protein